MVMEVQSDNAPVEYKIRKAFPDNYGVMLAIAEAESGLDPQAYNPEWHYDREGNPVCQGSYGIMQIACVHVENPDDLFDVEYNLKKAKEIEESSGLNPWGSYTDGRYLQYLKDAV